jgi:hypothetical protein
MFNAERDATDAARLHLERQVEAVVLEIRATTAEFMAALTVLIESFSGHPGEESRGTIRAAVGPRTRIPVGADADVDPAEAERHRDCATNTRSSGGGRRAAPSTMPTGVRHAAA